MNDKDIQKLILERMEASEQRAKELKACRYDGIAGSPPEWVPELIVGLFEQKRDIMLIEWEYSLDEAVKWLDRYISDKEDDWFYPGTYPNGRALDFVFFRDTIGFLALLRWCISLGEDEGLLLLAGQAALLGKKRMRQLKEFGERHGKDLKESRSKEWERWNNEAKKLIGMNPKLAENKSELARKIKAKLELSESIRAITRRID
ncbi:MAG: hypothetical protein ABW176_13105 [Candidatus Thiodiazotropha endolucinida]